MINALINHLLEPMEIGRKVDVSTIRFETGETMEVFLVLDWLKGEISHRTIHTVNQELKNLAVLPFADLTSDRRVVSQLMKNKSRENNKQTSYNVVRFTTTDDTINELSDLCPLNY